VQVNASARTTRGPSGKRWLAVLPATVVVVAVAVLLALPRVRPARPTPPNVLLISVCSIRPDHMSCYGYRRKTTPNLERFASESIVFEHAVTQWPKTVPAFAAIMTGKYGHTTGVMRITPFQRLPDEHETLAEVFAAHGYDTAAFIATPVLHARTNMLQGFQTVEEAWRLPPHMSDHGATRAALTWLRDRGIAGVPGESSSATRAGARPFFVWVHYNNAHQPYYPAAAPRGLFVGDEFYDAGRRVRVNTRPMDVAGLPPDHPYFDRVVQPDIGGVHLSAVLRENPTELDYYIAQYDACIRSVDLMASKLLRELRAMGLLETTIVALVGDHGESLGQHNYFFGHGRLPYEDSARVPLMIRLPGGVEPRRITLPVAAFDLAPTLLELAGITPPSEMEARSLLPLLRGEQTERYVFMECGYQRDYMLAVWHRQWKLIHIPSPIDRQFMTGAEYELYDLRHDPGELDNVYSSRPQVAAKLRRVLAEWSAPWRERAYRWPVVRGQLLDEETRERLRALGYLP